MFFSGGCMCFQIVFPDMKVVRELLTYGAPVNAQNCIKSTPLLLAASSDAFSSPVSITWAVAGK